MLNRLILQPGQYTAYEILEYVIRLVEAEPKRFDMRDWLKAYDEHICCFDTDLTLPECGTVACLAGWINIATGQQFHRDNFWNEFNADAAFEKLDLGPGRCLTDTDYDLRSELRYLFGSSTLGNEVAIQWLRRIMDKYKQCLQSKTVTVGSALDSAVWYC